MIIQTSVPAAHCVFKLRRRHTDQRADQQLPLSGGGRCWNQGALSSFSISFSFSISPSLTHSLTLLPPLSLRSLPLSLSLSLSLRIDADGPTLAAILRRTKPPIMSWDPKPEPLRRFTWATGSVAAHGRAGQQAGRVPRPQDGEEEEPGRQRARVREGNTVPHPDLPMEADQVGVDG